jgi:hypothetical protein
MLVFILAFILNFILAFMLAFMLEFMLEFMLALKEVLFKSGITFSLCLGWRNMHLCEM